MKLSEAILKGIEQFPIQAKGEYFTLSSNKQCACALGCVIYAITGIPRCVEDEFLYKSYPELSKEVTDPSSGDPKILFRTITDLNDFDGYSRKEIATWLAEQGY